MLFARTPEKSKMRPTWRKSRLAKVRFEARPPEGSALPGGVGHSFDWSLLAGRAYRHPWFLAGGLNAANVAHAIDVTGAPFVDVSSGVESAPGVKEPALIEAFLSAVKAAS